MNEKPTYEELEKRIQRLENMDITYGPELRFITPEKKTFQQLIPTSGPVSKLIGVLVTFVPQFLMTMMIKRLLLPMTLLLTLLAGCATDPYGYQRPATETERGLGIGAATGAAG